MTDTEIARLRLRTQRIAPAGEASPAGIVRHLGAVQAQDHAGALWSIALRTPAATRADVERAVAEREIVRTWPMRGTLHFVPAEDARWMLELLAPRVVKGAAGRHRQLELDAAVFRRSRTLVERALAGGGVLSRGALFDTLERGGISTSGQRGIHIVQRLSLECVLVFGPHEAKQPTFALFDEWVRRSVRLGRDDALRTLAARYVGGHGPVTLADFVRWAGLTVTDARRGLHLALPSLERVAAGDTELYMPAETSDARTPASRAHLLPGFDELMLGYGDRSASLAPQHAGRICPGANGMFLPTLLLDGRVCGTWKGAARAASVRIAATPFAPLTAPQRRLFDAPARRYAHFLGAEVVMAWAG